MNNQKIRFCISIMFIFFLTIIATTAETNKPKKRLSKRVRARSRPVYPSYQRWRDSGLTAEQIRRSREAREELKEFRDRQREKFEARQAERKEKKIEKKTAEESYEKGVLLLKRKVAKLDSIIKTLEKRVSLLEVIILDEDPNFLAEEPEKVQSKQSENTEKNNFSP